MAADFQDEPHLHLCPTCGQRWECSEGGTTWDQEDSDCRWFDRVVCVTCVKDRQRKMLAAILCLDNDGGFFFNDVELEQLAGSDDYPEAMLDNPYSAVREAAGNDL
jgi:hypothetical protein